MAAPQHHRDSADRVGDGHDQACLDEREIGVERLLESRDDAGQEEAQSVKPVGDSEVDQTETDDAGITQGLTGRLVTGVAEFFLLVGHRLHQPGALLEGQPLCVGGTIGEVEPDDKRQDHGGQTLDQVHHAPSGEAEQSVAVLDDGGRERGTERRRERKCQQEQAHQAYAVLLREPEGQVEKNSGEEAGLGDAQQNAEEIEAAHVRHECQRSGKDAPGEHDPRDPQPGAEAVQGQVARHLEQQVADKEETGRKAEHRLGHPEVGAHGELREGDVRTIQIVHEIEQDQKGDQSSRYLLHHARFDLARRNPTVSGGAIGGGHGRGTPRKRSALLSTK